MPRQGLRGFTLIEILVVITIIGILASLITVAALGALKHARLTEIKSEMDEIDAAFQTLKHKYGEYPPNCQFADDPRELQNFKDLKRYLKQIAPRNREPENLLRILSGIQPPPEDRKYFPKELSRGISASEAIVFWLGGISDDPSYPLSGNGGPSYVIPKHADILNRTLDPIESRKWIFPFDVSRLGARSTDSYFDEGDPTDPIRQRYVEYFLNGKWRRINFWQYTPRKSDQPYFYFDVSRRPPANGEEVSSTPWNYSLPAIYPIKRVDQRDGSGAPVSFRYVNAGKFQLLHSGLDGAWGNNQTNFMPFAIKPHMDYPGPDYQNFMRLDIDADGKVSPAEMKGMIVYPGGPWLDDLADTIVNFTTGTLEDPLR
jgi:prepilin-type N-terminal cleavage/methylation domain-containing protein